MGLLHQLISKNQKAARTSNYLENSMHQMDKTKATRQVVTLNQDCSINEGPVEEVPLSELPEPLPSDEVLPTIDSNTQAKTQNIAPLATFSRHIFVSSEIKDPVGIVLTALYTDANWNSLSQLAVNNR